MFPLIFASRPVSILEQRPKGVCTRGCATLGVSNSRLDQIWQKVRRLTTTSLKISQNSEVSQRSEPFFLIAILTSVSREKSTPLEPSDSEQNKTRGERIAQEQIASESQRVQESLTICSHLSTAWFHPFSGVLVHCACNLVTNIKRDREARVTTTEGGRGCPSKATSTPKRQ